MNKKVVAILTVTALTLSLSACGKDEKKEASKGTPKPTTTASPTPTATPTLSPTAAPEGTPKATSTPEVKPTDKTSSTQAPSTNNTWTPTPTQEPAPIPTQEPIPQPTQAPTPVPTPRPSVEVNAIMDKIMAEIKMGMMADVTQDMLKGMYYIDPSIVKQHSIKMPMINVKATEIAIIEVKDSVDLDKVQQGMEKRVVDLKKQWEHYLQDQLELVQNYKIQRRGNFIIMVISEDQDKVLNIFNNYFK